MKLLSKRWPLFLLLIAALGLGAAWLYQTYLPHVGLKAIWREFTGEKPPIEPPLKERPANERERKPIP
jgi:hypothetical protein